MIFTRKENDQISRTIQVRVDDELKQKSDVLPVKDAIPGRAKQLKSRQPRFLLSRLARR